MMRSGVWVLLLLAASSGAGADTSPTASATPITLSFGIVPQQTATRLARMWTPLLEELGRRSGYRLDFKTATNIATFDERVFAGDYDIVYVNPYRYPSAHRVAGYRAFAREAGQLQGLIVVRNDSPIRSVADLRGEIVAFPAPQAFAATILPLAQLHKQGFDIIPAYVGSHESVYLTVAKGLHKAGGGIHRTLGQMPAEVRDQLRVVWTSAPYTPHAIAAHPRVPRPALERLARAMVELKNDATGQALLQSVGFSAIVAARDSHWDDVRALRIDALEPMLRGGPP